MIYKHLRNFFPAIQIAGSIVFLSLKRLLSKTYLMHHPSVRISLLNVTSNKMNTVFEL